MFEWSDHVDGESACAVCLHLCDVGKGGSRKREKEKTGRPSIGSSRAAQIHTISVAPPQQPSPAQLRRGIPAEEITCPICTDLLERPVELVPCRSVVCHKCLVNWLEVTESFHCPCCYSDHLEDTDTIDPVTPLLLKLLSAVFVTCTQSTIVIQYSHCQSLCDPAIYSRG